jgi:membrane associated rhomboid family serine protease
MGVFNRTYWKDDGDGGGGIRFGLPRLSSAVTVLIGLCAFGFIATLLTGAEGSPLYAWLSLRVPLWFEVWRWITFQFMHGDPSHFLFNMLGLYFFAPTLDRHWGTGRFLAFYLLCGWAAGLTYSLLVLVWPAFLQVPLVGASGGIFACMAACAILFPEQIVFIFPIRWFVGFLAALYVLRILWGFGGNVGAKAQALQDAAHLGGMIAGAAWAKVRRAPGSPLESLRTKLQRGAWRRKQEAAAQRRAEVDRILDKVHREGLGSLSGREKKFLQEETDRQREGRGRGQA